MFITDVTHAPIKKARFIKNPCCQGCAIDDLEAGEGEDSYYQVARVVALSQKEYNAFAVELKQEHLFLDGLGGYLSTDPRDPLEFTSPQDLMEWEDGMYREVVEVRSQGLPTLLIDGQMKGHAVWVAVLEDEPYRG